MAAVPSTVHGQPALGRASTALAYLVLAAMALTIALPFLWMSVTALKKLPDVFVFGQVIPPEPQWHNFVLAWGRAPFGRYLFNSTFSAVAILGPQLATIVPAAYGFARLRFPGRDALFYLVLATMMVPVQVTFIPTFVIVSRLGWKDTYMALIVPFATSGFGIFLLRQAFQRIEQPFLDAARIDGCGHLGVMRHVLVPQSLPPLVTFGLFSFVAHYNDLFWPLVATDSALMRTITIGLAGFIDLDRGTHWNELMAASLLSTLPLIALFLFTQRFFVQSVAASGLKG